MITILLKTGKYTKTMLYINMVIAAFVFIAGLMELAKKINKNIEP